LNNFLMSQAPQLKGLPQLTVPELLQFGKYEWHYVNNKERLLKDKVPYRIGKLTFLHGHEIKAGWGAINLAKIYYERCRSNVIIAHHHRAQEWLVRTITGKHEGSWLIGCMCKLSAEFMPHNDWIHGFAVITFRDDGFFSVNNRKIIKGRVV